MPIIPRSIGEAFNLGYSFKPNVVECSRLITQHFAGLKVLTIAKDLDRLLLPHILVSAAKKIEVADPPPYMKILFDALHLADKDKTLYVSRIFRYEG